jgi:hypothetical protein
MQDKIREKTKPKKGLLVGKDIQQELSELGEGTPLEYIPTNSKISVEIREILVIKDTDIGAFRQSFEKFCKEWD